MTFSYMTKLLAKMIVSDRASILDHRTIKGDADLTAYDEECVDLYSNQLRRLFMNSDGRDWYSVLREIKKIAGVDVRIGFRAQDTIIDTCSTYGFHFKL